MGRLTSANAYFGIQKRTLVMVLSIARLTSQSRYSAVHLTTELAQESAVKFIFP